MSSDARTSLSPASAVAAARSMGLDLGADPVVTPLAGGVSGVVLLIDDGTRRVVLKQALAQLLVHGDWFAAPERALTEAAAVEVFAPLVPDRTPTLLGVSTTDCVLGMTAAPAGWDTWKERLLTGAVDVDREATVAQELGGMLARWHLGIAGDPALARRFDDYASFEQLRVTPFHRACMAQEPSLARAIDLCVRDLHEVRQCLVHGDFSPKNMVVADAGPGMWVLDFEVAHYGAAVFDLAFLHAHLLLKAVHRPDHAARLRQVAARFQDAYCALGAPGSHGGPAGRLAWHAACLVLARVVGLSPVAYLTQPQQHTARELARTVLGRPSGPVDGVWAALERGLR